MHHTPPFGRHPEVNIRCANTCGPFPFAALALVPSAGTDASANVYESEKVPMSCASAHFIPTTVSSYTCSNTTGTWTWQPSIAAVTADTSCLDPSQLDRSNVYQLVVAADNVDGSIAPLSPQHVEVQVCGNGISATDNIQLSVAAQLSSQYPLPFRNLGKRNEMLAPAAVISYQVNNTSPGHNSIRPSGSKSWLPVTKTGDCVAVQTDLLPGK